MYARSDTDIFRRTFLEKKMYRKHIEVIIRMDLSFDLSFRRNVYITYTALCDIILKSS